MFQSNHLIGFGSGGVAAAIGIQATGGSVVLDGLYKVHKDLKASMGLFH